MLIVMMLSFQACIKDHDYSIEPVLKYKDFHQIRNLSGQLAEGILVLEFTDGDGDIGLGQDDTLPPFHLGGDNYFNFYIDLFIRKEGQYIPVTFPDTGYSFNSRIPPIQFNGNSIAIKGEIEYTFDMLIMKPFLQSDTIMIETYIKDRALHKSNVVSTPDIIML